MPMYLRSVSSYLPEHRSVVQEIDDGLVEATHAQQLDVSGVYVSKHLSPGDMAVAAALPIVDDESSEHRIDHLIHACAYHQGFDMWPVASYVHRHVLARECPALELRQASNGALIAMTLTRSLLLEPGAGDTLITTADRFALPGVDRWRSDPGTVLADGATASVFSARDGFAEVIALKTVTDSTLEQLHRGDRSASVVPLGHGSPLSMSSPAQEFLRSSGGQGALSRMRRGQERCVQETLRQAGSSMDAMRWVLLPHFGRRRLEAHYVRRLPLELERTQWAWSRGVGHLGAGDPIASLAHLGANGLMYEGDLVLLLGVGAGFSWSCAVLRILRRPGHNEAVELMADQTQS